MKATHGDLEIVLNKDAIEEQSEEMLRALLKVEIKHSDNPRYTKRMNEAMRRIKLRLEEIENEKKDKTNWNRIFWLIGIASIVATALIYVLPRLEQ